MKPWVINTHHLWNLYKPIYRDQSKVHIDFKEPAKF
nr:MAG TPA: hypothetical protein [Caudoviricetes sp.]